MKYLRTTFFVVAICCLARTSVLAQNVTYLDENHKPATAESYAYKRVIKYKEPVINLNIGTDYYGGITTNPRPTGLHICSITDYYKAGEPALVGNVVSGDVSCSRLGGFDGQVVAYYRNGNIKRKEPWKAGKLNGVVIFYDEAGNEKERNEYVNGNLIDENKFAAPVESPLIGTWKYVEYLNSGYQIGSVKVPPAVKRTLVVTYSRNGVVAVTSTNTLSTSTEKRNWKYIPRTSTTGIEEDYLGDELVERDTIRWINIDRFECTVVFHLNSNLVGERLIFTRQ